MDANPATNFTSLTTYRGYTIEPMDTCGPFGVVYSYYPGDDCDGEPAPWARTLDDAMAEIDAELGPNYELWLERGLWFVLVPLVGFVALYQMLRHPA